MTAPAAASPELALLAAVTAALKADAGLMAIVTGVYDEVPTGKRPGVPPYVYAGPINRQRLSDSYAEAWTLRLRLYAASTGFGRRQAWTIISAVSDAIDRIEPTLAAPYAAVGEMLVIQAGDVIEDPIKTAFLDVQVIVQKDSANG